MLTNLKNNKMCHPDCRTKDFSLTDCPYIKQDQLSRYSKRINI
jgi:hypothetical protein